MKINSPPLISELKTFIAHGGSYEAKQGSTDDLVSAALIAVRMMQQLQNYIASVDTHIRDYGEEIEPMPFLATFY
jgi:hypothetical protein